MVYARCAFFGNTPRLRRSVEARDVWSQGLEQEGPAISRRAIDVSPLRYAARLVDAQPIGGNDRLVNLAGTHTTLPTVRAHTGWRHIAVEVARMDKLRPVPGLAARIEYLPKPALDLADPGRFTEITMADQPKLMARHRHIEHHQLGRERQNRCRKNAEPSPRTDSVERGGAAVGHEPLA